MKDLIEKMAKAYWDNGKLPIGYKQAFWRVLEAISTSGTHAVVPKTALDWLYGSGPDANGEWFTPPDNAWPYWWRTHFRELIKTRPRE